MAARVIRGKVVDRASAPVRGARVYFVSGPVSLPDIAAVADERGRFELTAPVPGRYVVGAAGDDGTPAQQSVEVKNSDPTPITLRLDL